MSKSSETIDERTTKSLGKVAVMGCMLIAETTPDEAVDLPHNNRYYSYRQVLLLLKFDSGFSIFSCFGWPDD